MKDFDLKSPDEQQKKGGIEQELLQFEQEYSNIEDKENSSSLDENEKEEGRNYYFYQDTDEAEQQHKSTAQDSQCRNRCTQNIQAVRKQIDQSLQKKYEGQFTFYFSKPINELLSNIPTHHVIMFKEFLFIDDDNQYLKRFYTSDEQCKRIYQLQTFHQKIFPPCKPQFYALDLAPLMIKHHNAHDKVFFRDNQRCEQSLPQTQREQHPSNNQDLYLESQSSFDQQEQQYFQDSQERSKYSENLNNDIENQQNFHQRNDKINDYNNNNDNKLQEQYNQFLNKQQEHYYNNNNNNNNNNVEEVNLYSQKYNKASSSQVQQQQVHNPQSNNFQKLRSRDADFNKYPHQMHQQREQLEEDQDDDDINYEDKDMIDCDNICTPKKDHFRIKSHSQAERECNIEQKGERKNTHKNQGQLLPQIGNESYDYKTPRDNQKFNALKCKDSIDFEDNVREAFMMANSNSQKRSKEEQRRDWDAQNRDFNKKKNDQQEHNGKHFQGNLNQCQFGDENVEEMFKILQKQNRIKNNNIQGYDDFDDQGQRVKITDSEFEADLDMENDFSLHTHEFMDDREEEQQRNTIENERFYQNFICGNKDEDIFDIEKGNVDFYEDQNDKMDLSNELNNYNNLSQNQQEFKRNQDDSQHYQYNDQENSYDDDGSNNQIHNQDNLFGDGSFMKELNNYELEKSFETETFDVYNPQFSSDQDDSYSNNFLQEEEKLFKKVWDFSDFDDQISKYVVGKEEFDQICRCNVQANDKENMRQSTQQKEQNDISSMKRQTANDERAILKQQNIQVSDCSDTTSTKQVLSNEISQLQKVPSTTQSQAKNHPQIQNNQAPKQKSISSLKQQLSPDMPKQVVDLSPRNIPFLVEMNELNPNYQNTSQNFNEILQAQIQNQIMIKQRLEQQKADNSSLYKLLEQNPQYYSNYSMKAENVTPPSQSQSIQQQQSGQGQQFSMHQSPSQNGLNHQQQQRNNHTYSNTTVSNQKTQGYFNNGSNHFANNNLFSANHQSLHNQNTVQQQKSKPVYSNTKKKLANQLQTQNPPQTSSSSSVAIQNNIQSNNTQQNSIQGKHQKQIDFFANNGQQQQQNNSQNNYNPNLVGGGDASSSSLMAAITKHGQTVQEISSRSKYFDMNVMQNVKKSESSSTHNTLDSTKKPISSLIEQSQGSHYNQLQNQTSKLKSNLNINNGSQHQYNLLSNTSQAHSGFTQQLNQSKSNILNNTAKNTNTSNQNLKSNLIKGQANASPAHKLDILSSNQQGIPQQYKPFNQISQNFSNNQSKLEPRNIASLAVSTSSSQKGLNNNQQQYHQITALNNQSQKGRAKMHGKEKRNISINQSNPGSISLSNIKKQSYLNQTETPFHNNNANQQSQQCISSQGKYHLMNQHAESQYQQELLQYFQSLGDNHSSLKHNQNNLMQTICEKKNDLVQNIVNSPQDKLEQYNQYQYISPPQKISEGNKTNTQLSGIGRFTNKSISHSTNLFTRDEAVRNSQQVQITNGVQRNSIKKNNEIAQGVGNSTTDINWHPILMKQGSKEQIQKPSTENQKYHPILAQNSISKTSALNIEVQRRISLKHLKIKENNHFIGTHKNRSIEKEHPDVGHIQTRLDETNLSKKQNSLKMNQKKFPHLNNSVGDSSPMKQKDDTSNAASIIDSHREFQYSNNSHHNQIVHSLLSLHQVNPQFDQIIKKPSINFLPSQQASNKGNYNTVNHHPQYGESASKLAISIYQQNLNKAASGSNQGVINSFPTNNSYNHHSRSFNSNIPVPGNGLSQSNSRMNSQEKLFTRSTKNKSLDENTRKKNIIQQQHYQQNRQFQNQNGNSNIRLSASPNNNLPQQQQYYYPPSTSSYQVPSTSTYQASSNFMPYMSPQPNSNTNTLLNQTQSAQPNPILNRYSIDMSMTPVSNEQHPLPHLNDQKLCNNEGDSNNKNNNKNNNIIQNSINKKQQLGKSRIKQNNPLFSSQMSQSLQQSQSSMHQYKNSTPIQQPPVNQQLAPDESQCKGRLLLKYDSNYCFFNKLENQISSPRFKNIKQKQVILNDQTEIQQNIHQNKNQNVGLIQSISPFQSHNQPLLQQQQNPGQNQNFEKEKQILNNSKSLKGNTKKLHHSHSTNIQTIKKNNFLKQQEIMIATQQQHNSLADGASQNSSYGFLTSRSAKKSQKEQQHAQQKINIHDSPYNMDGIKRDSKQNQQTSQQQQITNSNVQAVNTIISNNNNQIISSNAQPHQSLKNHSRKTKSNKQIPNKVILPENQEEGQQSSQQNSTYNQEMNKCQQNIHPNPSIDFDHQDQQQHQYHQANNNHQQEQYSQLNPQFFNGLSNQNEIIYGGQAALVQNNQQLKNVGQLVQQNYSSQNNENFNKIKHDLKQNALDIIKTQKRKK